MRYISIYTTLLFVVITLLIISCNKKHNNDEIEAAMKNYDRQIQNMNADSIAMLFTPDGNLGDMVFGRDSIRSFLATFKNVHVLSTISTTGSIELNADSSTQVGSYQQVDIIDNKDTIHVKGSYTAKWKWISGQGWLIKKMTTKGIEE